MLPGLQSTLARSVLIVVATWTVVFGLASNVPILSLPGYWIYGLTGALVAVVIGVTGYLLWRRFVIHDHSSIDGPESDGAKVTLFLGLDPTKSDKRLLPVPYALAKPERAPLNKKILRLLRQWEGYDAYISKYPIHGRAFNAVAEVLAAKLELAASHVPGGHAGLSLFEHSINVVRAAARMANSYKYYGLYRNGKLSKPVADPRGFYAFPKDDPVIPLAALAHDIGKLVSYKIVNGQTTKKMEAHDIPGRRLLNLIPEIYELPPEDKHALMMAVGLYHHIHGGLADGSYRDGIFYSDWITDRIYAVVHFLEYIDIQTGRVEAGQPPQPFFVPYSARKREEEAIQEQPDQGTITMANREPQPVQTAEQIQTYTPAPETTEGSIYYQWFLEFIEYNVRQKKNIVAHRYGDWIYVDDVQWRKWLKISGKPISNPESLLRQPNMGVIHPVTAELLKDLADKGLLLMEANGKRYRYKNALFNVAVKKQNGDTKTRKFVIVVSASISPAARKLKESQFELAVERSSFGEQKAIKDGQTVADSSATEEVEPVIDNIEIGFNDFMIWLKQVQSFANNEVPPYPEREGPDGHQYVVFDRSEIPERFHTIDFSTIDGVRISQSTPGLIGVRKDLLDQQELL